MRPQIMVNHIAKILIPVFIIWVAVSINLLNIQMARVEVSVNFIKERIEGNEVVVNEEPNPMLTTPAIPIVMLKPIPLFNRDTTMINPRELKELVIKPTLDEMSELWGPGVNREAAVNLIVGTYLQESVVNGVTHLTQLGNGPAKGIFQIEPDTEQDIWDSYLAHRPGKASYVRGLMSQHMTDFGPDLSGNLRYQVAMCRLKYWQRRFKWPQDPNDIEALGTIWDRQYNTNPDHGFVSDYVHAYKAAGEF